tara:strand:- start:1516 stop:3705 length:2190 start_codon:yes stop_codon:yes gene_type:complete
MKLQVIDRSRRSTQNLRQHIENREYIGLGKYGKIVVQNPFIDMDESPEDIAMGINKFLEDNAAALATTLARTNSRTEMCLWGSFALNGGCKNLLVSLQTHSAGKMCGVIGQEFIDVAPRHVKGLIKPITVNAFRRITTNTLPATNYDKSLTNVTIRKPTLADHLAFWIMNTESYSPEQFLTPDDAYQLLQGQTDFERAYEMVRHTIISNLSTAFAARILGLDEKDGQIKNLTAQLLAIYEKQPTQLKGYNIYWKGKVAGNISDPITNKWYITPDKSWILPFNHENSGDIPAFFENLLPEVDGIEANQLKGFLEQEPDLMGDISIRKQHSTRPPSVSKIGEELEAHITEQNIYTGKIDGIGVLTGEHTQKTTLVDSTSKVRLSGFATKIPVHLIAKGPNAVIRPSEDGNHFTHIMKIPKNYEMAHLQLSEWFGMVMAKAAGVNVPTFALVDNNGKNIVKTTSFSSVELNGFDDILAETLSSELFRFGDTLDTYPNYVVERFDLTNDESTNLKIGEDFASYLGIMSKAKYTGADMSDVASALKAITTDWKADAETLLRQLTVNMLINNNDMHAKNLSILRTYDAATKQMIDCRLSPAYDIVCMPPSLYGSRVSTAHGMALNGNNEYCLDTLVDFAINCLDIQRTHTIKIIQDVGNKVLLASKNVQKEASPALSQAHPEALPKLREMGRFVKASYLELFADMPEEDSTNEISHNDVQEDLDNDVQAFAFNLI